MHSCMCVCYTTGAEGGAFLFTWLRMSSNKILTWARNANYQSKVGSDEVPCVAPGLHGSLASTSVQH